ncbi:MAG: flavohemoglobin expression-modulating QEGLA motif protein [Planctomycetota bacterium]|nr:flavohemoglobin expression-modulating QEGLA motif protein [Planctomycetota bacterium]
MPADAADQQYRAMVRSISDRLVEAQRPIRILDAIKWDNAVQDAFFRAGCREQPPITRDYYANRPLGFDPDAKRAEFQTLEHDIQRTLGQFSPVGAILRRMCDEYQTAVRLIEARGTPEFARLSQELYGSPSDVFHAGDPNLADLGEMMDEALVNIDRATVLKPEDKTISGEEAVAILQQRLDKVFPAADPPVRVIISDGIVADAAAGADYIKIRKEARFSERDLKLLEVHEGWVHLGTTLNGINQPVCTFLSKGPPSSTITQEGLAMLMEVIAFASFPGRLRRLTNRIRAVDMAEKGATFVDVFNFFREQGFPDSESYVNTTRVFRGSLPTLGPFTKDITYTKGFVLVYNYIRLAVRKGLLDRIPMLFCGKTTLEDVRTLAQLRDEGVVAPPRFLPPQIADLNALTAWMCYSNFLNRLDLNRIEADYVNIL